MLEFRILGPLEVVVGGRPVVLGAKQRALLAVLLLHRGEPLSGERLIDLLWGERPPATAQANLRMHVANLRKTLGSEALLTEKGGYLLAPAVGMVDADRFAGLADEARTALTNGDAGSARELLRQALGLWRGEPLADLGYEQFAQAEIARLQEARLGALEDRIDSELALGEGPALVAELEALVREHPLRERLHGKLMLALYRSGRQADALERYQQTRRKLLDELGLEPGVELQELERAILNHDPALGVARRAPSWRRARRGASMLALGGALLAAAAIVATLELVGGAGSSAGLQLAPDSLGLVDPATGHVRASLSIAGTLARVQVTGAQVWVTSDDAQTASLIDAGTASIAKVAPLGEFPSDFAVGEGAVWVIDRVSGRLVKVSPTYAAVVGSAAIGSTQIVSSRDDRYDVADPWSIAAGAGGVWVTDGSSLLREADPSTGRISHTYDTRMPLNGVAVGEHAVWAISGPSASVLRVDPRTGRVTARVAIVTVRGAESPYPQAVATGAGSVWVLNGTTASVTRIDPVQGGVTATIPIGIERVPRRLAIGDGAVWVANADGTLTRIDTTTDAPTTTDVAPSLYDVAVGPRGVWVTSGTAIAGGNLPASTPAGAQAQPLPASQCSPIYYAPGTRPRYLIVSDLPLGGPMFLHDPSAQLEQAIEFELRQRAFRAGRFALGYQACDDYNPSQTDPATIWARCPANMRAYASDHSVLGVIGPFNSGCAVGEIAIANRAQSGPLAMISPSTTAVGLTHRGPGSQPGEPRIYYPTGIRNFVRTVAPDDVQGAADALLARQLGLRRVFVAHELDPSYGLGIAQSFAHAAVNLGLVVTGLRQWPAERGPTGAVDLPAVAALVRTIAQTHPDGVFLGGGGADPVVAQLIRALRAAMPNLQLIGPDGFALFPDLVRLVGQSAEGMLISQPEIAPALLRGPGQQFASTFGKRISGTFYPWTAYAAQATDVLLDAIARSNGTRTSVTRALLATRVQDGIIGSFAFTSTGDPTVGSLTIIRVKQGQPALLRVITTH